MNANVAEMRADMLDSWGQADLSLRRAAFRVRRRLGRLRPFDAAADKVWTIAPAEIVQTRPSVFLPGQPDKIRALSWGGQWSADNLRIHGGATHREAVTAYRLSDAAFIAGSILCKGSERRVLPYEAGAPVMPRGPVVDIDAAAFCGTYLGLLYFGHWLRDDSTLELLASGFAEPVASVTHEWPHKHRYRDLLELSSRTIAAARFRTLFVFDDEDYSTSKAERMRTLRKRAAGAAPAGAARRVFIKRGLNDEGPRCLLNEDELAAALARSGFLVVDPVRAGVDEIASAISGADLLVGPEGSQLAHAAMFLRDGGRILAITSPDRFSAGHKRWADHFDIRYGFVIGDAGEGGHNADLDDVRRTVDLLERA